jgi:hypothetical protein
LVKKHGSGEGADVEMKEEEEKSPIPFVSNHCLDDQNGELDQISYFLRKPEILKMHLEILYKSVNFINE